NDQMQKFDIIIRQIFCQSACKYHVAVDYHVEIVDCHSKIIQIFIPPFFIRGSAFAQFKKESLDIFLWSQQRSNRAVGVYTAFLSAIARLSVRHHDHMFKYTAFVCSVLKKAAVDDNGSADV